MHVGPNTIISSYEEILQQSAGAFNEQRLQSTVFDLPSTSLVPGNKTNHEIQEIPKKQVKKNNPQPKHRLK